VAREGLSAAIRWYRGRLLVCFVVEFAEIAEALAKGAGKCVAPSARLKLHGLLVQLDIRGSEEVHIAGLECHEFFDGDASFDFSAGMFLFDGEKVETGEIF